MRYLITYRDPERSTDTVEAANAATLDTVTAGGAQRETLLLVDDAGVVVFAAPGDAVLSIRKWG